jgi:hypothetical protein
MRTPVTRNAPSMSFLNKYIGLKKCQGKTARINGNIFLKAGARGIGEYHHGAGGPTSCSSSDRGCARPFVFYLDG